MCTAITYQTKDFYFGRTFDYDVSFAEEVTITPRHFVLSYRNGIAFSEHFAMIGMAHVVEESPLYFDAVNEKGLAMAALNFEGYAQYGEPVSGKDNIAHFELISWILGQCSSVTEALKKLETIHITNEAFNRELPPSQLHWIIADHHRSIVVESQKDGLHIYDNPTGVLTNNPTFPEHLLHLTDFMGLSPQEPENRFSGSLSLKPYSRGMGAMGLPGDLSSRSRFVRAAFTRLNAQSGAGEMESVNQFFHILGAVEQVKGCCRLENNACEMSLYTSCCNTDKGIYYYTTYENHQICAIHLHREKLDDSFLIRYPLVHTEQIQQIN